MSLVYVNLVKGGSTGSLGCLLKDNRKKIRTKPELNILKQYK